MIYNFISPDTTIKTVGYVATTASSVLKRTNTLINGFHNGKPNGFVEEGRAERTVF